MKSERGLLSEGEGPRNMDLPFTSCFQGRVTPLNFKKETFDISSFHFSTIITQLLVAMTKKMMHFRVKMRLLVPPPVSLDLLVGKLVGW